MDDCSWTIIVGLRFWLQHLDAKGLELPAQCSRGAYGLTKGFVDDGGKKVKAEVMPGGCVGCQCAVNGKKVQLRCLSSWFACTFCAGENQAKLKSDFAVARERVAPVPL